jgi:calcineurin-like phosphoesterase family protein
MDEIIINNWNKRVKDTDTIYMLGDFVFARRDPRLPAWYLKKLRGKKYLLKGNHDRRETFRAGWDGVYNELDIIIDNQRLFLTHYYVWNWYEEHPNSWHLYGHVHGRRAPKYGAIDVGVDAFNFKPVSWEEIKDIMVELKDQSSSSSLSIR